MKLFSLLTISFSLMVTSANVFAQASPVSSVLTANVVTVVDGKTLNKPASEAKPGDVIEYSATYANNGKTTIDRLQAVIPVPPGTVLLDKSASPTDAMASVDSTTFMPMPLSRTVKLQNGGVRTEPTPLSDYRALRWTLGAIAPGQQATVALKVRVEAPLATPVSPVSVSKP